MRFFRKKKGAPLSKSVYQGGNKTPAHCTTMKPPILGTKDDTKETINKGEKTKFFDQNQKQRYVNVTPDNKAERNEPREQSDKTALVTPIKSPMNVSCDEAEPSPVCIINPINNESDVCVSPFMTPQKRGKMPSTPEEMQFLTDTKRDLSGAFDCSFETELHANTDRKSTQKREKTSPNSQFLRRLRESWRFSPKKEGRTVAENLTKQQQQGEMVPKMITRDEGSVPSLITELTGSVNEPPNAEKQVFATAEPFSVVSKPRRSKESFGQKFLSLLSCDQDTTNGYFGGIKCLDLCGPVGMEDGLRLQKEEDRRFVTQFMNKLSKQGIKLIYHKAPSSNDPSSDWTQLTIRMFLRSGNCHDNMQHPSLAWAILPVVSQKVLMGSYDIEESNKEMWTYLSLWDIYSIMGAEDDITVNDEATKSPSGSEYTTRSTIQGANLVGDTYTRDRMSPTFDREGILPPSSGFFSLTAGSDGNVFVFEAHTASQRDYIVKGLKKLVRRASNQMINGKKDVVAELYGEDAAPACGELPSLVTPTQALGRVTHMFLDGL